MKRVLMLSCLHRHDDVRIYHKEALALKRAGYRVVVACPGKAPGGLKVKTAELSLPGGRLRRMALGWITGVGAGVESGAKVLHIHDPELLPAGLVLKALGKRVVYDAHEDLPRQIAHKEYISDRFKPMVSAVAGFVERAAASRMDLVIGATPAIAARLGGICIRNLPDKRELNIPILSRMPWQVCYLGLVSEARGLRVMAQAARLAGVRIMLAGDWEDDALRKEFTSGQYSGYVSAVGRLDRHEAGRLLAGSLCGLCVLEDTPAYREAIPTKLLEYMAAGLPFIASDFPAWRVLGGAGGLYVPPGDAAALALAIRQIRDEPGLAQELSAAGAAAAAKLNFENEEARLIAAYRTLC